MRTLVYNLYLVCPNTSSSPEPKAEILNIANNVEIEVQKWLDKPLGELLEPLKIEDSFQARLKKHPIVSFINQVQLEKTNADFSAVALFNDANGFNQKITMRDIVSTYVYSNTLVVLKIKGSKFKSFLEKCAEYFDVENGKIIVNQSYIYPKPLHFNYDMVDGLDYVIDVSKPIGNRVVEMKKGDKDINLENYYTLVLSSYRASGGGEFVMLDECEVVKEVQEDMVDILAEYISRYKKVVVKHRDNISVIA